MVKNLALQNFRVRIQVCMLCLFPPNLTNKSENFHAALFLSSETMAQMSQHMGIQFDCLAVCYCFSFEAIVQARSIEN